jgi:hypothetical protein
MKRIEAPGLVQIPCRCISACVVRIGKLLFAHIYPRLQYGSLSRVCSLVFSVNELLRILEVLTFRNKYLLLQNFNIMINLDGHKPRYMAEPLRVYHAQHSPLTVNQIVKFLGDLNKCYASIVIFFNIDSKESAEEVVATLVSSRLNSRLVVDKSTQFDSLVVRSININSPGWLEFLGAIKPFEFLIDLYKEYNSHQRWKRENRITEQKAGLEVEVQQIDVMEKKIAFFRKHGVPEDLIQQLVVSLVAKPSQRLIEQNPNFNVNDIPRDMPNG